MEKILYAKRTCPFCDAKTESLATTNTICSGCGAKYYVSLRKWLNRKTGVYRGGINYTFKK